MSAAFTPGPWGKDALDAATLARFIQRPTNRDCTDQIAEIIEALEQVSKLCPPLVGDYDDTATPSDFGNSDDYARHVEALTIARVGDVARAALAKARGEA